MRKRTRIRLAVARVAGALQSSMLDQEPLDEEGLRWIRARVKSAYSLEPGVLAAHYVGDVERLLDEVDRLRYDLDEAQRGGR